ncbi:MAG: hypothetical protein HQ546_05110 [Planctomycetes bacterium]|nr:hypothetical protein [Planctomycetota bacterium]
MDEHSRLKAQLVGELVSYAVLLTVDQLQELNLEFSRVFSSHVSGPQESSSAPLLLQFHPSADLKT